MAYDDIFQPRIYKAWNEAIIKEKKIRMKWHADYESKTKQATSEDVQRELPEPPCTCKEHRVGTVLEDEDEMKWPRKGATGTNTIMRVLDTPSSMIIPSPTVRSILYEGISRDDKGRSGYLKKRWKSDPENRYHSQVCTSWTYGWNCGKENELSCKDPDNCNIRKIAFGFQ